MSRKTRTKANKIELLKQDINEWNSWRKTSTRPYASGGVLVDLSGVDLSNTDLTGANLRLVTLDGSSLRGAKLIRTDLSEASLLKTDIREANLYEANLSFANLSSAKADNQTNFAGTNLHMADFNGCNLAYSELDQAWSSEAKNLNLAKNVKLTDLEAWLEHRQIKEIRVSAAVEDATEVKLVDRNRYSAKKVLIVYAKDLEFAVTSLKDILDSHVPAEDWSPDCNAKKIDMSRQDFRALEKLVLATNEWRVEEDAEDLVMLFLERIHNCIKNIRPYSQKVGEVVKELGGVSKDLTGLGGLWIKIASAIERIVVAAQTNDGDKVD